MTDDLETGVSSNPSTSKKGKKQIIEYTDEELEMLIKDDVMIEMLIKDDVMIEMKCPSCGYEEEVPDWILKEFLEMEL